MIIVIVASLVVPLLVSVGATVIVRRVALRIGFIDHPRAHKAHAAPVALGGGIAILAGAALPVLLGLGAVCLLPADTVQSLLPDALRPHLDGLREKAPGALALIGCAVALHALGLFDDRKALGPMIKLAVQVAVALVVTVGLEIRALELLGPWVSVAVTVVWIVLITNAFNFLDNMDGLCAGVASIVALILAGAALSAGQIFVPVLALVIAGSLLGFLLHNFPPASIFMGDAGSLPVGFLLAVLATLTTFYDPRLATQPAGMFVPPLAFAVPLYDSFSVICIRLRAGESVMRGDRRHFSHRLLKRGMSPRAALLTICLATAATGLSAVAMTRASWLVASLIAAQCACVVAMVAVMEFGPRGNKSDQ